MSSGDCGLGSSLQCKDPELALSHQASALCVVAYGPARWWHRNPGTRDFLRPADPAITLVKFTGPAAQNLHQHPHTGISDPTSLGVGWPAPHLERHPRHRVVPATSGCVLKAEARVGGFCSWLGSGESIKTQIGNRVSVLPLRGDSPKPPAGCWGLRSGFPKRTLHNHGQGKTASRYPTVSSLASSSCLVQNVLVPEAKIGPERFSKEDRGGAKRGSCQRDAEGTQRNEGCGAKTTWTTQAAA